MPKKKTKQSKKIQINKRYIIAAAIIALAIFLYLKIVYFPGRADINEIELPLVINDGDIANARTMDIDTLSSFTGDYIVSANTVASLERFYQKTNDEKVALSLIQMYISSNEFDKAFGLIKDVYHNEIDFSLIPANTFLYVLFNSSELSPSNYAILQSILEEYKQNVRIDNETYTLYNGLLAVYRDDAKTFYGAIHTLSGSKQYESLYQGIKNAQTAAQNIGTTVPYYVDALSSIVLLQE